MSAKTSRQNKTTPSTQPSRWRAFWVAFLVSLGTIALANWLVLRWTELYLFNTAKYVETIAPLTKNQTVADALSTYATDKLYSTVNLEQEIRQALPERAGFIAAPLAGQIQTATQKIGTKIIASDQFNSIWIAANQTAHAKLIATLEKPQREFAAEKDRVVFGVNISPFLERLRDRLQTSSDAANAPVAKLQQVGEVNVALRDQISIMRTSYQLSNALYALLPVLIAACYLGAIAVANSRWRASLAVALAITVITALQLIFYKAARPEIIAQVELQYQAAAAVIWDTMTAGFKTVTTNTMFVGVGLTILAMLAGPYSWAHRFRQMIGLDRLAQSSVGQSTLTARLWLRERIQAFRIAGIVLGFIVLIVKASLSWQTLVMAVLAYCVYLSVIEILAKRVTPAISKA